MQGVEIPSMTVPRKRSGDLLRELLASDSRLSAFPIHSINQVLATLSALFKPSIEFSKFGPDRDTENQCQLRQVSPTRLQPPPPRCAYFRGLLKTGVGLVVGRDIVTETNKSFDVACHLFKNATHEIFNQNTHDFTSARV